MGVTEVPALARGQTSFIATKSWVASSFKDNLPDPQHTIYLNTIHISSPDSAGQIPSPQDVTFGYRDG